MTDSAANGVTDQLVALRDVLEECLDECRTTSEQKLSRQKSLLLQKLEVFRQINASVRQQIKKVLQKEVYRREINQQVHALLEKMTQTERENQELRLSLSERESKAQELMGLRGKEMETVESVNQLSQSLQASRARLQGQLRNRETENSRLLGLLKDLERTVPQRKMELQELRTELGSVSVMASEEKEALQKAIRAHKHRADKFATAVEKCYDQLRDKDVQLADARSERDQWRCLQEEAAEQRVQLDAQITLLKDEVSALSAKLQRERDTVKATELLLLKIEKLNNEKAELTLYNSTLKASILELEEKGQDSEAGLQDQTVLMEKRKQEMETCQSQVAELHVRVTELKITLETLHQETKELREGRDAEVAKVWEGLEGQLKQLDRSSEFLRSAQQSLLQREQELLHYKHTITHKTQIIRQLHLKTEEQEEKLKSSLQMEDLVAEANAQLHQMVVSLQRKLEEVECENQRLICRLASQEGALQYSRKHLEERSAECQALSRQIEGTLTDATQQVCEVKEKASLKETDLLNRIQELETEKNQRENELRQLQHSTLSIEKRFEMRLRDLRLSLDQSESHKRSIQNYVDFLKNSYTDMFEELLSPSCSSSHFLK